MELIATIRPFAELAYFCAGVLLAISLGFTFRQVQLVKRDMEMRSDRSAKEKAIEASMRYATAVIPATNDFDRELISKKIERYGDNIGDFSRKSLQGKKFRIISSSDMKLIELMAKALNELNTYSLYFVTSVADEQVGFDIYGRSFCYNVEAYYDFISFFRDDPAAQHWSSIVTLYKLWRPRLETSELQAQISELHRKLKSAQGRP